MAQSSSYHFDIRPSNIGAHRRTPQWLKRFSKLISPMLILQIFFANFAESQTRVIGISERVPPPWMYHWIDVDGLLQPWRVEKLKKTGRLPLPKMKETFLIVQSLPALENRGGLFLWTHPVTGLGTGPEELYGEAVIMLKLSENPIRILELETEMDSILDVKFKNNDFDMIHHKRIDRGIDARGEYVVTVVWEEFVLTNDRVVTDFTADPRHIRPRIQKQIARLESGLKYQERFLHFKAPGEGMYSRTLPFFNSKKDVDRRIMPILRNYVAMDPGRIPTFWRRPIRFGKCDELNEDF